MIKKYGGVMNGQHETMEEILISIVYFLTNLVSSKKTSHFHLQREKISRIVNTHFTLIISRIVTWSYQILLVKTSSMVINETDQKIVSTSINRMIQNIAIKSWM